jgi:hypothetical protein
MQLITIIIFCFFYNLTFGVAAKVDSSRFIFVIKVKGIFAYQSHKKEPLFLFDSSYSHYIRNSLKVIDDSTIEFSFYVNDYENSKYCFNHIVTFRENINSKNYLIIQKKHTCLQKDHSFLVDRTSYSTDGFKHEYDSLYRITVFSSPVMLRNKFSIVPVSGFNYYSFSEAIFYGNQVFYVENGKLMRYDGSDTTMLVDGFSGLFSKISPIHNLAYDKENNRIYFLKGKLSGFLNTGQKQVLYFYSLNENYKTVILEFKHYNKFPVKMIVKPSTTNLFLVDSKGRLFEIQINEKIKKKILRNRDLIDFALIN